MSDEKNTQDTQQTVSQTQAVSNQIPDIQQIVGMTTLKYLKRAELFKKYAEKLSPKDRNHYQLLLKDVYANLPDDNIDDEKIFQTVYDELAKLEKNNADNADNQQTKTDNKQTVSPPPSPAMNQTVTDNNTMFTPQPDYPLADDEKYFKARLKHHLATRKLKTTTENFVDNILSQIITS
jgi:hypothetical protein